MVSRERLRQTLTADFHHRHRNDLSPRGFLLG
jgi:hypothetical protein